MFTIMNDSSSMRLTTVPSGSYDQDRGRRARRQRLDQGRPGSLIARAIDLLRGRGTAVALVTHVTVDPADPAFGTPSKPIGPFYEPAEAERVARRGGWVVRPDSGRGYRRVVASPQPVGVIEIEAMRALVEAGHLVIAG